jgi:adenine-specific DNA-methyltransferase
MLCSTNENDVVFDPYMGAGTVAVVARRYGRIFIGAEADEDYFEVAQHRLNGEPDNNGNFPNLRSLREYAEKEGIHDVSEFSFTRQTGSKATTRKQAKIHPEPIHLDLFMKQAEGEADNPAHKRFAKTEDDPST